MALGPQIEADVVLGIDQGQVTDTLTGVTEALNTAIKSVLSLGKSFGPALAEGEKEARAAKQSIDLLTSTLNALSRVSEQLKRVSGPDMFAALDEQRIGRKVAEVGKITRSLEQATGITDAFNLRIAALNKQMATMAEQGRSAGSYDVAKLMNMEKAKNDLTSLQRQLSQLDRTRAGASGASENITGYRAQIDTQMGALFEAVKNPNLVGFDSMIAKLQEMISVYRELPAVEKQVTKETIDLAKQREAALLEELDVETRTMAARAKNAEMAIASSREQSKAVIDSLLARQQAEQRSFDAEIKAETELQKQREAALTEELDVETRTMAARVKNAEMVAAANRAQTKQVVEGLVEQQKAKKLEIDQEIALDDRALEAQVKNDATRRQLLKAQAAALIEQQTAAKKSFDENNKKALAPSFFGSIQSSFAKKGGFTGAAVNAVENTVLYGGAFQMLSALQSGAGFVVDYEEKLRQLQAIAGSTDTEMKGLAASIGEVGANSKSSITEIADAAEILVQAGYSAAETGKVLKDVITLSAASGSTPSESVELLTSTLGAFNLTADASGHIVDVLVNGLNNTKLTVQQMAQAVQYAGATAHESGVSFEELTTIAGSLANAGIRSGSTIGTGLRQMLIEFQEPTKKFKNALQEVGVTLDEVDIKTHSFADIVKTLTDAGFGATQAFEAFDKRGAASYLAFKGQLGNYDNLALQMAQEGTAAEAQAKSMDNLGAQWQRFKNILGDFAEGAGSPVLAILKDMLEVVSGLVLGVEALIHPLDGLIESLTGVSGAATGVMSDAALGGLIGSVLPGVGTAIGAAVGALVGLIGTLTNTSASLDKAQAAANKTGATLQDTTQKVTSIDEAIKRLVDRQDSLSSNSVALETEVQNLQGRFEGLTLSLDKGARAYQSLIDQMLNFEQQTIRQQQLDAQSDTSARLKVIDTQQQTLAEIAQTTRQRQKFSNQKDFSALDSDTFGTIQRLSGMQAGDKGYVDLVQHLQADKIALENFTRIYDQKHPNMLAGLKPESFDVLDLATNAYSAASSIVGNETGIKSNSNIIDFAAALQTRDAQRLARLNLKDRQIANSAIAADKKDPNGGDLDKAIALMNANITYLTNRLAGKEGTPEGRMISGVIEQQKEILGQLSHSSAGDDADLKGFKAWQPTSAETAARAIRKAFPGIDVYSTGKRSLAEQKYLYDQYLHHGGALAAKPGTSEHGEGRAMDIKLPPGVTLDNVADFIETVLKLNVTQAIMETGKNGVRHGHIGIAPQLSPYAKRHQKAVNRAETIDSNLDSFSDREDVKAAKSDMKDVIDKHGSEDDLTAAYKIYHDAIIAAFKKKWEKADPNSEQYKNALTKVQEELKTTLENYQDKLTKAVFKSQQDAIDKSIKNIESDYTQASNAIQAKVDEMDSRLKQAKSWQNRNTVGAGTLYHLEAEQRRLQPQLDQQLLGEMKTERNRLDTEYMNQGELASRVGAKHGYDSDEFAAAKEKVRAVKDKISTLDEKIAKQEAKINEEMSKTPIAPLTERLRDAARAWQEVSGAGDSWGKVMENNIGPALDTMTTGFNDFFMAIATGTKSFGAALRDMLLSFAKFVEEMLIKALALRVVQMILGAITGGGGAPGASYESSTGEYAISTSRQFTGGLAGHPMKLFGGGEVTQGFSSHDSVPALLAKDEYVVRGQSVKSLGIDFMDSINRDGAKALSRMGGSPPMAHRPVHQETNVYVVKPDEPMQLGPNDVKLVIQNDILQGGITKQLIRSVAQGA